MKNRTYQAMAMVCLLAVMGLLLARILTLAERGLWVDEVSQLLNHPLPGILSYFGPLPQAQQAAPPLFNLILDQIHGLELVQIRMFLALAIIAVILLCMGLATGWAPGPMAIAVVLLFASSNALKQITEIKHYGLEAAGFAIFTTWLFLKDPEEKFRLRDIAILAFGGLLGISTLVGALLAGLTFALRRLVARRLCPSETAGLAVLCLLGGLYYLQIGHATSLQISTFENDVYSASGAGAAVLTMSNMIWAIGIYGLPLVALGLACLVVLSLRNPQYRWLLIYLAVLLGAFGLLSFLGKYPAVSIRHVFWVIGAAMPTLAVIVAGLRSRGSGAGSVLGSAASGVIAVAACGILAYVSSSRPSLPAGSYDRIVAALTEMEAATVVLYHEATTLVPLALKRGEAIGHHRFTPRISTGSAFIDPYYRSPDFLGSGAETISAAVRDWLDADMTGAFIMTSATLRFAGDFSPLAEFVLDRAPGGSEEFYIVGFHVPPDETNYRYFALTQALTRRGCGYDMDQRFDTPRSPGFLLRASCP